MYELKKNGKVFTSKSVGTGPSSFEKRINRAAVSQRLRNTRLECPQNTYIEYLLQYTSITQINTNIVLCTLTYYAYIGIEFLP